MVCYRCQRAHHVSICIDCRTAIERLEEDLRKAKRDLDWMTRKYRSARCDERRAIGRKLGGKG